MGAGTTEESPRRAWSIPPSPRVGCKLSPTCSNPAEVGIVLWHSKRRVAAQHDLERIVFRRFGLMLCRQQQHMLCRHSTLERAERSAAGEVSFRYDYHMDSCKLVAELEGKWEEIMTFDIL